jgi:hypothetical protein
MLCHHNWPLQVITEIFARMLTPKLKPIFFSILFAMAPALFGNSSAWAYKVEKICEDIPASTTVPAHKKCKVVRANEKAPAKGDGKGDAKADAKKDPKAGGH